MMAGITPEEGEWPARDRPVVWAKNISREQAEEMFPVAVALDELREQYGDAIDRAIGSEIPVTPEMVAVVRGFPGAYVIGDRSDEWIVALLRAALAVQQIPLISDGERAAALERDEARINLETLEATSGRAVDLLGKMLAAVHDERDEALKIIVTHADTLSIQQEILVHLRAQLAARDARIAELDTMLAARPVPEPPACGFPHKALTAGNKAPVGMVEGRR